ncbi:MAG: CoA transferase [Planctomycetes bacterium]|nr:CoA transferase [Planctomycetota bacterium]
MALAHCTSLLGLLGHEVIKVETAPDGDPLRRRAPVVQLAAGSASLPFLWTSRAKRWVSVGDDRQRVETIGRLAADADVVLASDPAETAGAKGRRLTLTLSPFGQVGRRAGWRAGSFSLFHAGGPGYVTPRAPQDGTDAVVTPQAPWGHVAEYFAGIHTAVVVLAYAHQAGPPILELSMQQILLPLMRREMAAWRYDGRRPSRRERLWRVAPSGYYRTRDGWCYVNVIEDQQWKALCAILGKEEWAEEPRLATAESRFENLDLLAPVLEGWLAAHTSAEVFERCGRARVPVGPANDPKQILASPQLASRGALPSSWGGTRMPELPPVRGLHQDVPPWSLPAVGADNEAFLPRTATGLRP